MDMHKLGRTILTIIFIAAVTLLTIAAVRSRIYPDVAFGQALSDRNNWISAALIGVVVYIVVWKTIIKK
jgi:hypothetical protein